MKKKLIVFAAIAAALVLLILALTLGVPQLRFLSEAKKYAEKFAEYRTDYEAIEVYLEKTFERVEKEDLTVRFGLVGDAEGKLFCMRRGTGKLETITPDDETGAHLDAIMRAFVQLGTELRGLRIQDGVLKFDGDAYCVLYSFSGEKPDMEDGRIAKLDPPWYQLILKEEASHA